MQIGKKLEEIEVIPKVRPQKEPEPVKVTPPVKAPERETVKVER